jgi:hypothetical protein
MKPSASSRSFWRISLVALLFLGLQQLVIADTDYMIFAFGSSKKTNPDSAGKEAARNALLKIGTAAVPRLALVINALGDGTETGVLNGVSLVVTDTSIIAGGNQPALFSPVDRTDMVTIWVAAGPGGIYKSASSYSGTGANAMKTCGATIGSALNNAPVPPNYGKLVFLLGGCDYARDSSVVEGVISSMGDAVPLIGMSSVSSTAEVFSGKSVLPVSGTLNSNLGIVLYGAFAAHFGFVTTAGNSSINAAVADGYNAARTAVQQGPGRKPDAMLFFDCTGRRDRLSTAGLPRELDTLKLAAGTGTPFMGCYCYGEIGKANDGARPVGLGLSISACALFSDTLQASTLISIARPDQHAFFALCNGAIQLQPPFDAQWSMRVMSSNGSTVMAQRISGSMQTVIPAASLSAGTYVIQLMSGNSRINQPLVIAR